MANGVAPQLSLRPPSGATTLAGSGRGGGGGSTVFVTAAGFCVLRGVIAGGSPRPGDGGVWRATGDHRCRFRVRVVVVVVVGGGGGG